MKKNEDRYVVIENCNRYVKGIVGQRIQLSLIDKIKILFSKGIAVVFVGPDIKSQKGV